MGKVRLGIGCQIGIIGIADRMRFIEGIPLRLLDPSKNLDGLLFAYEAHSLGSGYKFLLQVCHEGDVLFSNGLS